MPYEGASWVPLTELPAAGGSFGYEAQAIADWQDPAIIRGKGLTQAQSRIDQYAY